MGAAKQDILLEVYWRVSVVLFYFGGVKTAAWKC